ncbi:MAG: SDR family NAD(P)-dependent oxidoreductase [Bacteroidetes bacterium]|nr:SDR family NAD(P)-dependent oxidoreductase [Bacteroidota bacterium]
MNKTVLITGATSGFGEAMAYVFAAAGDRLILTGRNENKLAAISADLISKHNVAVHTLCFDIQNKEAVFAAVQSLPAGFTSIDVLINNAGLALGRDSFQDASIEDWETMIDTNVKGLLYISKAVLPLLINNKKGHIINIGSTAGVEVYKDGNVYCASKHAVAAISKSMRIDLLPHHIKVTAIHPGAAETNFSSIRFKGDAAKAAAVYEGYKALEAVDVANIAYYATTLPDHVCINEFVVTCTSQANSFYLQK